MLTNAWHSSSIFLNYRATETYSPGLEPRTDFCGCFLYSCNLSAETNNFVIGAVLLSYLVSELRKPSSLGLEPRNYPGFRNFLKSFQGYNAEIGDAVAQAV
jgi:hypothetical protein